MLRRFCYSLPKVVRYMQIVNHTHAYLAPATFNLSQKRNYVIVPKSNSSDTIEKLKNQMENKARATLSDLQSLLTTIKDKKIDAAQAHEILNICCHSEQNIESNILISIWEELKKQDNVYQIQHYNCLLQWARDKQDKILAQQFFDELINANIKPNAISYKYLLFTFCTAGDIDKAIEVLEMMDKNNLHMDDGGFNKLVQCHILCGNIGAANETIESLKQTGGKLYPQTLEISLKHYAKAGDLDNVIKTFDRFNEEKIDLLNRNVLVTIGELAENGMADKIDSLLPYLKVNSDLQKTLDKFISFFVKKKQSVHMIKLIQLTDGDATTLYKKLIERMVRFSSTEAEFNEVFDKLEASGFTMEKNFNIFPSAVDCSSEEIIRRLLAHMKSHSIEVNERMFQKLFQLSTEKGVEAVLDVVKLMCSDFKIQPQITFIQEFILPGFDSQKRPEFAYATLESTSINPRNTFYAIINEQLNNGSIEKAYELASTKNYFYGIDLIKQSLVKAFITSGNFPSYVSFVKLIHKSFSEINNYDKDSKLSEDEIVKKQNDFVSEMWSSLNNGLLNAFAKEGLAINIDGADNIQTQLKVDKNPQVDQLTKKNQMAQGGRPSNDKLLVFSNPRGLKGTETTLGKEIVTLNDCGYAMIIDKYASAGDLEKALNTLKRASTTNISFKMDFVKVARLVKLMVEKNCPFEEIEAILSAHMPSKPETRIFLFENLMNNLASRGETQLLQKLFDALVKYNYIQVTSESSGLLIRASLNNGAYAEAVDKFEHFAKTYQIISMTMILFIQLIQQNQVDLLHRAYKTYEQRYGTRNALCSLGFAFVECENDREAKAAFEKVNELSKNVIKECKDYVKFVRLKTAKTLLIATKGLHCSRDVIYQAILEIYIKQNKAEDALDLWREYSNDDIKPTQIFKKKLTTLLNKNCMEPPFELNLSNENMKM